MGNGSSANNSGNKASIRNPMGPGSSGQNPSSPVSFFGLSRPSNHPEFFPFAERRRQTPLDRPLVMGRVTHDSYRFTSYQRVKRIFVT